MKTLFTTIFFFGGVALSIAAMPVFGQVDGVGISRQPLKDFAAYAKAKNIDWTKPFLVEAETVLTKNGRFDKEQTKYTETEGDAETIEVVKRAFEAADESGWLIYLRNQGFEKIKLSARRTAENFSLSLIAEQPTPERANTIASGINGLIYSVLMLERKNQTKLGDDEKKVLSGTKVTAQEKTVTINISLAAAAFQEMMRRRLNEGKEAKTAK